jgi:uncharacterized membrane protein
VKLFLAIVSSACLGVASLFAWAGFWPVLPFAGLEIGLLTYALWWTSARARQMEVVDVGEQHVAVEKGARHPEQRWSFSRSWARVSLVGPAVKQHPSRLFIGSHGQRVRVGDFLTENERQRLASDIRSALAGVVLTSTPNYEEMNWSEQS